MLFGWSTRCSLSWTRSNGQEAKSSSQLAHSMTTQVLFTPLGSPSAAFKLLMSLNLELSDVFTTFVSYCRHSNVVILTTSNVTEKIDLAFVDRADIKQYIGPPSVKGIYSIYLSCLEELMKVFDVLLFFFFPQTNDFKAKSPRLTWSLSS